MIQDQNEREKALRTFSENTLVIAGAGTGKTSLLTGRVLTALLGQGLEPEQILVTTFTESAAQEMAERIELALRHCSQGELPPGGDAARALAALGLAPEGVQALAQRLLQVGLPPMQTIHSFCLGVLRDFSREAGLPPNLDLLDEVARDQLFAAFFQGFLDSEFGEGKPILSEEQWDRCFQWLSMEELRELLEKWLSNPRWAALPLDKDLAPLQERGRALHAQMRDQIAAVYETCSLRAGCNFETVLVPFHRALGEFVEKGLDCRKTPEWLAIAAMLPSGMERTPGVPSKYAQKELLEGLFKTCRSMLQSISKIPDSETLEALGILLAELSNRFKEFCAIQGKLSFDDMIERTRQLVCRGDRVRDLLRQRYRLILVDEFQDTDPSQNELFLQLGDRAGSLFVVGDPKQSIYRFRGADMEAYEEATTRILAQGSTCKLSANFRSRPEILDFVNRICAVRISPSPGLQPPYEELSSGREFPPPSQPAIRLLRSECPRRTPAPERRIQEARILGAQLLARRERIGSDEAWKGVGLLVRTLNTGEILAKELRKMGVPVLKEGGKKFYERFEIQRFLALLGLMVHPHDEASLLAILRSPLAAIPDGELLRYAKQVQGGDAPPFGELLLLGEEALGGLPEPLREAILSLQTLRARILDLPSDLALKRLLWDSGLQVAEAASYDGHQRLANLQLFIDDCATRLREEGGDLHAAYDNLIRQAQRATDFNEASLFDPETRAVRVMTIHKAKGLEFDLTILADLTARKNHKSSKGAFGFKTSSGRWRTVFDIGSCNSPQFFLMEERRKQHEEAQERRLEYVAMTRARSELWLSWNSVPTNKAAFELPDLLEGLGLEDRIEGFTAEEEEPQARGRPSSKLSLDTVDHWIKLREKTARRAFASMRASLLPPSSQDQGTPQERGQVREGPSHAPNPEGEAFAKNLGTLCHWVLQQRIERGLAERMAVARNWVRQVPGEEDRERLLAECAMIFDAFEGSPLQDRLDRGRVLEQELPILHRGRDGKTWRGTMDLLLEEGGDLVVVDFKTNRLGEDGILSLASRYQWQLRVYQEAIQAAYDLEEAPEGEIWVLREGISHRYPKP